MPLKGPSPWRKGGKVVASILTAMWNAIRENQLTVDSSTGLNCLSTPTGKRLTLTLPEPPRRAVVTQAITPPSSATATHTAAAGWGFAQLQRWDDATSRYANTGAPVRVINPWPATSTTATVDKVIWVSFSDGVWQMVGENCP